MNVYLSVAFGVGSAVCAVSASSQGAAPAAAPRIASVQPPRLKEVSFTDGKALVGLPAVGMRASGPCSSDGLTYFEGSSSATEGTGPLDLYSVSNFGEVKHFLRAKPQDYDIVLRRNFYAAEHSLVTLIEAGKRDERNPDGPAVDVHYFVSVSDHTGEGGKVVLLDVRFKPLRIAMFGSGDFLVVGWDEANLLPVAAVVKEDGTLRRFLDTSVRQTKTSQAGAVPSFGEGATYKSLQGSAFVPSGGDVLVTYPGTVKPIHVIRAFGQDGVIQLALPGGYVLHDVLNSGERSSTIVARVQPEEEVEKAEPKLRIFEFNRYTGARLREFAMEKVSPAALTCAANDSLIAVFAEALNGAPNSANEKTAEPKQARRLVVGMVHR